MKTLTYDHNFLPFLFTSVMTLQLFIYSHHCSFNSINYPLSTVTYFIQFLSYLNEIVAILILRLCDLLQRLFPTFKTFLPYFLPDRPQTGYFEKFFSSPLFLNYHKHHLGKVSYYKLITFKIK